ncbi:MAG: hypothetical protein F6K56_09220 [Moorea sp. SIO3G5]|nr:hypothetical protein [Moorena sp. SIO3G5]
MPMLNQGIDESDGFFGKIITIKAWVIGEWHTQSGVEETLIRNSFLGEEREQR